MPLLDHFHPPLAPRRHWESFHVNWAGAIADDLNESLLPEGYFAEEHAQLGPMVEIDVATFTDHEPAAQRSGGTAILPPRVWAPPAPAMVVPAAFPDAFEVLVFESRGRGAAGGRHRAGQPGQQGPRRASPGVRGQVRQLPVPRDQPHRDRHRHQPAGKPARRDPECPRAMAMPSPYPPRPSCTGTPTGRSSVRGSRRSRSGRHRLEVGRTLPVLPLALNAEIVLPIDLEATYTAACQRRRLA